MKEFATFTMTNDPGMNKTMHQYFQIPSTKEGQHWKSVKIRPRLLSADSREKKAPLAQN